MLIRAMTIAAALAGSAVGLAGPAWADEPLNGLYTYVNDESTSTWTISTSCDPFGTCSGVATSSSGWSAPIGRLAGGPWTIERIDAPDGWECADGSTGPADLSYSFDPASLVGTVIFTAKPGACNDANFGYDHKPISLRRL